MEKRRGRPGQTSPGEERGNETGKVVIAHGGSSAEFCEAAPIGLADESKESLYGRETNRDPRNADLRSTYRRHVDASRDFSFFSERAAWGGRGRCQIYLFIYLFIFPVQQTTSGIGHRVK